MLGLVKKQSFWIHYVKYKIIIFSNKRIELISPLTDQLVEEIKLDNRYIAKSSGDLYITLSNNETETNLLVSNKSDKTRLISVINNLCSQINL